MEWAAGGGPPPPSRLLKVEVPMEMERLRVVVVSIWLTFCFVSHRLGARRPQQRVGRRRRRRRRRRTVAFR